jgi:hypothetical protein
MQPPKNPASAGGCHVTYIRNVRTLPIAHRVRPEMQNGVYRNEFFRKYSNLAHPRSVRT